MSDPILSIGTFGVHIIKNPAGTFSFVGTVPNDCGGCYPTFQDAFDAFIDFFKEQDVSWQKENVGNLRNDAFKAVIEYGNKN